MRYAFDWDGGCLKIGGKSIPGHILDWLKLPFGNNRDAVATGTYRITVERLADDG